MINFQALSNVAAQLDSFAQRSTGEAYQSLIGQLSTEFANTLSQFGINPSSLKSAPDFSSGQTAAPVWNTAKSLAASVAPSAAPPTASASEAPAAGPSEAAASAPAISTNPSSSSKIGFNALVPADNLTPEVYPVSTAPSQHWYGANAADDAYWSKQPAAVQQMREISDPAQRETLGTQLAAEGYQIDVPIMVWGWDAGITTSLRQTMGYTWVPSANQNPVSAAPGITGPGITPYDPNHPPAGSIAV